MAPRGQGCQAWTAVGLPPRYPQFFENNCTKISLWSLRYRDAKKQRSDPWKLQAFITFTVWKGYFSRISGLFDNSGLKWMLYIVQSGYLDWSWSALCVLQPVQSRAAGVVRLDPEIDRVGLWRSIRGKYRSTRSIDSIDFILDSLYLPRLLADRTDGGAYATVVLRPSASVVIVASELWINDAS